MRFRNQICPRTRHGSTMHYFDSTVRQRLADGVTRTRCSNSNHVRYPSANLICNFIPSWCTPIQWIWSVSWQHTNLQGTKVQTCEKNHLALLGYRTQPIFCFINLKQFLFMLIWKSKIAFHNLSTQNQYPEIHDPSFTNA